MSVTDWSDRSEYSTSAQRPLPKTPQYLIYSLSAAACIVAAFRNPWWSAIAYAVLLLGGSGLLFYDRVRSVTASRKGHLTARYVTRLDQGAVVALLMGCVLNGLVVAADLARG